MTTNDDRREVAERLRNELRYMRGNDRYEEDEDEVECGNSAYRNIAGSVELGGNFEKGNYVHIVERLADLIDPTCDMDAVDTGEQADYECREHIMHCSACNAEFGYVLYSEDRGVSMDDKPRFCPNCGARVVDE